MYEIILWSQSGAEYAESVAKVLKIDHLVSLYMSKPQEYCDDLPETAWMNRVFKEELK